MASAEREPITAVWGRSPQRGLGAEPLVRSQGRSPLKLKPFSFCTSNGSGKFAFFPIPALDILNCKLISRLTATVHGKKKIK